MMLHTKQWIVSGIASLALLAGGAGPAMAQQKELRIAYQPNPLQEASIDMMVCRLTPILAPTSSWLRRSTARWERTDSASVM